MQNWTTPQLQELEVSLTANKRPDIIEAEATVIDGVFVTATMNAYEGEIPNPYPCIPPKETPQS